MAKPKTDLQKHTLNFFRGDLERLAALYPELDVSTVVRQLIHEHVEQVEAQVPTPSVVVKV